MNTLCFFCGHDEENHEDDACCGAEGREWSCTCNFFAPVETEDA